MMNVPTYRIELNGAPAQVDTLRALVQTSYGHFTSMQVREGCVRGLGLHLDRLVQATRELFGSELDRELVRAWLGQAIANDPRPLSLRVTVFSRALDRARMNAPANVDVLVSVGAGAPAAAAPLRLKTFRYQRELPAIKHVGTFPLFHYRRLAQQAGRDDALFVADDGRISEGSVWNIVFFDNHGAIWPDAPQLRGVSLQLLQAGLARRGAAGRVQAIRIDDLPGIRGAFFTNSSVPVQPIARIDDIELAVDDTLTVALHQAYDSSPLEPV
jgi:branched-subunit amino acid aminotransferase/4-amino-4-deoxychorismate lyase